MLALELKTIIKEESMKKTAVKIIVVVMLMSVSAYGVNAQSLTLTKNIQDLTDLQKGVTKEEIEETVALYAQKTGQSEEEVSDEILEKLNKEIKLDDEEAREQQLQGGSAGDYKLNPSQLKGDLFYTPSTTLTMDHGHNGIYYTTTTIVESIPKKGVRKLSYNDRKVEKNAVMQTITTNSATASQRKAAANWAKSRVDIGDGYSYNFATNRLTGHYGNKNCSKLIWSAFQLKADGLDIDVDEGAGVYPRDIRDSSHTFTYKTIN